MELISAYADGELSGSDERLVREHLDECESCSALLALYREISVAVDESGVPAPEALRGRVMERVLGDNAAQVSTAPAAGNVNKRKQARVMLLRYVPIAACLAIMLISMPWIINTLNRTSYDSEAPEVSLLQATVYDSPDEDNGSMRFAGGSGTARMEDGAPAPEAAPDAVPELPAAIPAPSEADARLYFDDDNFDGAEFTTGTPVTTGGEAQSDPSSVDMASPIQPEPSATSQPTGDDAAWSRNADAEPEAVFDLPMDGVLDLLEHFSDAYAWIELTGDLPKMLESYDPEPLDGWLDWEVYYVISRSAAQELIKETHTREGFTLTINHKDGSYAIVLYSSG